MKRSLLAAVVLLGLSLPGGALAQSAEPKQIEEFLMVPLPTFAAADLGSARRDLDEAELAGQPTPWPILEVSDSGMYLVEFKSDRVWVLDSTVKVDAMASGSAFTPEAMNFNDKDLAGSRGYGD
jgi:hypothetical protein